MMYLFLYNHACTYIVYLIAFRPDDKNQMMEMLQRLDKEHPVLDSDDEEEEESGMIEYYVKT